MDIKVNNISQTTQMTGPEQPKEANGDFKFMLTSKLEDTGLAERENCETQRHQRHAALQDSYKRFYE